MRRTISERELVHERLGEDFRRALSDYDTARRVETLVDEFLGPERVRGREVLDVGCGLGFFSKRLVELGGDVTACDIGPQLVAKTAALAGCRAVVADALDLTGQFEPNRFDVVVSSECIEHTPSPPKALREMAGVLKPGGWLSLSTPNVVWLPVVKLATWLRLRPFDGIERFSTFGGIRRVLDDAGVSVVRKVGLHLWPFQLPAHRLSRWADAHAQAAKALMINLCVLGQKR